MIEEILHHEKMKYQRLRNALLACGILFTFYALTTGTADISIVEIASVFRDKFSRVQETSIVEALVWDIRLPRILCGLMVGAGLSVAGTIFQAILRNPLADPYTIGVSTGAAFGAVLAIFLSLTYGIFLPTVPVAFLAALLTLILIIRISGHQHILHSSRLILAGIIVSAVLSAGISLMKSMAGEDVSAIVYWLMGRLTAKSWRDVWLLGTVLLPTCAVAFHYSEDLDLMTLGMHQAESLGVDVQKRMKMYLILAALITAACVSVAGIIGFVGLVVPHILRMWFTTKHQYLLPLAGLCGALVLAIADNISRVLLAVEIPVGILTTLLGGPFFIYVYGKGKEKEII